MTWADLINDERVKPYMKNLYANIKYNKELGYVVYPDDLRIFKAYELTPFNQVKVVIIGQDPYHDGNADGLAFSCKNNVSPTLKVILRSLGKEDYDPLSPYSLQSWAEQGVLLINTMLTVIKSKPESFKNFGWEVFTTKMIASLIHESNFPYAKPLTILAWGNFARNMIDSALTYLRNERKGCNSNLNIIICEHPTACLYGNRNWINKDCFNKTNKFLVDNDLKSIKWV